MSKHMAFIILTWCHLVLKSARTVWISTAEDQKESIHRLLLIIIRRRRRRDLCILNSCCIAVLLKWFYSIVSIMASRAMSYYWRNMVNSMGKNRSFVSSTTPKMKAAAYAPSHGYPQQNQATKPRRVGGWVNGQFVPVYVAVGLIACSLTLGAYTAEHQLRYNPSVRLKKKKRRDTMPEVVDPDGVMEEADGFINKSWFRKISHVQEFQDPVVPDSIRGDVFSKPKTAESLESVGVDPSGH